MTAIAGYWTFNGRGGANDSCNRMLSAQAVYGPHGQVNWSGDSCSIGRSIFRTLPEDVHDRGPVIGGDGKLVLVADLRLDNRQELICALRMPPEQARTSCDASILMCALEHWGEAAVDRLAGDFAFALWNERDQRLLLARDFLGQRPLHYHRGKDFFAFGSMPKGLHALPAITRAPNYRAAADFLMFGTAFGEDSFFAGVTRVEPGHMVLISRDGIRSRRYWHPPIRGQRLANSTEYEEALREGLDTAVSARLRGTDGRVGAHLSAGLDSSAVAATAARLLRGSGGEVCAFTSVPNGRLEPGAAGNSIADEGPFAAATARLHANIRHSLIRSDSSPLDNLDRNFFLYERPLPNLCNGVWWDEINTAAKERGLGVMLTGSMGNLSFSYSGMDLLPELFARGRLFRLLGNVVSLQRNGTRWGTIGAQLLGPFLPATVLKAISSLRGGSSSTALVNPAAVTDLLKSRRRTCDPGRHAVSIGEAARWRAFGQVDVGNYNKGVLAGWGIDMRDPSADRRLVEFCLGVPRDQFLQDGVPRSLARRAFADRVPARVLNERRKGLQAADWYQALGAAQPQLREEIARIRNCAASARLVDAEQMLDTVEHWPETPTNDPALHRRYRFELLRAISAGHFVRSCAGSTTWFRA